MSRTVAGSLFHSLRHWHTNNTRPCNSNADVTHTYEYINIYSKTQGYLYHRSKQTSPLDVNRP